MDKIIKTVMLAVIVVCCMEACHLFDDNREMDNVAIYFNESNVTVFEGGLGSVTLRVEPTEALANENVEYEMGNEEVATIYRADKRGCVFYGNQKGSTILKARLRGAEAKMVITVMAN